MELSEILNLVLGGGLLAAVIGLLTLKATVRKANAEAEKARAEAETVRIDNTEQATRILIDNIVEPLKKELNETREELRATKKEFGSTKREMARLRKAIGDAGNCKHSGDCPVLFRLREHPKDCEGDLFTIIGDLMGIKHCFPKYLPDRKLRCCRHTGISFLFSNGIDVAGKAQWIP